MNDNPFFCEEDLTDISHKRDYPKPRTDRNRIFRLIEESCQKHNYISLSTLVKISGKGRTTIDTIVGDFEHARLIESRVILNKQNRSEKIIFLPKSDEVKDD